MRLDDGHGDDDLLNLIVEIKGYRREDAKDKRATMEQYWVPGVNNLKQYGRWAFAEFGDVFTMQQDFAKKVAVTDDSDLEEVYNTERHLLYVACTRPRDNLLVTAVFPGSEFLGDLVAKS